MDSQPSSGQVNQSNERIAQRRYVGDSSPSTSGRRSIGGTKPAIDSLCECFNEIYERRRISVPVTQIGGAFDHLQPLFTLIDSLYGNLCGKSWISSTLFDDSVGEEKRTATPLGISSSTSSFCSCNEECVQFFLNDDWAQGGVCDKFVYREVYCGMLLFHVHNGSFEKWLRKEYLMETSRLIVLGEELYRGICATLEMAAKCLHPGEGAPENLTVIDNWCVFIDVLAMHLSKARKVKSSKIPSFLYLLPYPDLSREEALCYESHVHLLESLIRLALKIKDISDERVVRIQWGEVYTLVDYFGSNTRKCLSSKIKTPEEAMFLSVEKSTLMCLHLFLHFLCSFNRDEKLAQMILSDESFLCGCVEIANWYIAHWHSSPWASVVDKQNACLSTPILYRLSCMVGVNILKFILHTRRNCEEKAFLFTPSWFTDILSRIDSLLNLGTACSNTLADCDEDIQFSVIPAVFFHCDEHLIMYLECTATTFPYLKELIQKDDLDERCMPPLASLCNSFCPLRTMCSFVSYVYYDPHCIKNLLLSSENSCLKYMLLCLKSISYYNVVEQTSPSVPLAILSEVIVCLSALSELLSETGRIPFNAKILIEKIDNVTSILTQHLKNGENF